MTKRLNALPYRRLKMMANGIWDEARQEFYPFKLGNKSGSLNTIIVTAKNGVRYYVLSWSITIRNTAATDGEGVFIRGYQYAVLVDIGGCTIIPSVASVNTNSGISNVLLDNNSAITAATASGKAVGYYNLYTVYAEIPADPAGGPVMIS